MLSLSAQTLLENLLEEGETFTTIEKWVNEVKEYCVENGLEVIVTNQKQLLGKDNETVLYCLTLKRSQGRPAVGVTRKVSLTLPPAQMVEFETIANENNIKLAHLLRIAVQFYLENCDEVVIQ